MVAAKASLEMLCYMLSHEAHHRGQMCMLAHQFGFPLPIEVTSRMWNWEKLWKECGSPRRPGFDSEGTGRHQARAIPDGRDTCPAERSPRVQTQESHVDFGDNGLSRKRASTRIPC